MGELERLLRASEPGGRLSTAAGHGGRGVAAAAIVLLATIAGIGWLYLLRHAAVLGYGPRLREALPLQRLAGGDAQPLLRLACTWIPAGLVAGLALRASTRLTWAARVLVTGAGAWVVLFVAGAGSDSVTASEKLAPHLAPQFGRGALWVAAALVAAGALCVARRREA
ncbi:MAG TPA: hypothetical protein VFT42_08745 [Solirubrobacteraceae bacterium]|nr:hypothetical protein [Solirubrobacteraceae bacterium]